MLRPSQLLILQLLREGPSVGLRTVITGDRSLLLGKVAGVVERKLVLRLADRNDYTLASLNPRTLPDAIPVGRAFEAVSSVEVQIGVLGADPSGSAQLEALKALAETLRKAVPVMSHPPMRVDVLPERIRRYLGWAGI